MADCRPQRWAYGAPAQRPTTQLDMLGARRAGAEADRTPQPKAGRMVRWRRGRPHTTTQVDMLGAWCAGAEADCTPYNTIQIKMLGARYAGAEADRTPRP